MAYITEHQLRAMLAKGIPDPYVLQPDEKLTPAALDFLKTRKIAVETGLRGIPVGVSNRHIHLSPQDVEALFGSGYELTPLRELSQKGQFAASETVTLHGPKGTISGVRILGPARGATQVEISRTDGFALGIHAPVRLSGDIEGTPGIVLIGMKGKITIERGVIVAKSHVHLSPQDAESLRVSEGDRLMLQTSGDRPLIFPDVVARINPRFSLDFHVDTDEANAAGLKTGDRVQLIGRNGKFV